MRLMMRLLAAVLLALGSPGAAAAPAPRPVAVAVRVLAWGDYVDPRVLDAFTRATGLPVVLNTYDSVATMEERLASGAPYDVVVTPAAQLAAAIKTGRYRTLDYARLPHAGSLDAVIAARLATLDPGNRHAVDYMWFATGLAYNVQMASERLGSGAEAVAIDTWDTLFKADTVQKFTDCGIQVMDEPDVVFPIAFNLLRLGSRYRFDSEVVKAADLLEQLRPVTKMFSTPDAVASLASGEVCLALVPADLATQAKRRAADARSDADIGFVIPREGAPLTLDVLAIPANAGHPDAAYRFIDFLLQPDIAARSSNYTRLGNGVPASRPLMDQALAADPGVYPSADVMQRLYMPGSYDPRQEKLIERYWTKVKTGKLGS